MVQYCNVGMLLGLYSQKASTLSKNLIIFFQKNLRFFLPIDENAQKLLRKRIRRLRMVADQSVFCQIYQNYVKGACIQFY